MFPMKITKKHLKHAEMAMVEYMFKVERGWASSLSGDRSPNVVFRILVNSK